MKYRNIKQLKEKMEKNKKYGESVIKNINQMTLTHRFSINELKKTVENMDFEIVAMDTDAVFINFNGRT